MSASAITSNGKGLVLIVARNNIHLTRKAVTSALAQDYPCNVWVIDNASNDGTRDWLRARSSKEYRLHWWVNLVQRSLSTCWNAGLKRAFAQDYDRVLVINNDVILRPDTYRLLADFTNGLSHQHQPTRLHFVSAISVRSKSELRLDEEPSTWSPHPDFSCFMIDRYCFETVGGFDEHYYPAFVEDCAYHVRMHRAGIEAGAIDLPFVHHGSQTIKHADPAEQAEIKRGADANRERFKATYGCYPSDTIAYDALFVRPRPRPTSTLVTTKPKVKTKIATIRASSIDAT